MYHNVRLELAGSGACVGHLEVRQRPLQVALEAALDVRQEGRQRAFAKLEGGDLGQARKAIDTLDRKSVV